jgi:hypothetical protein
LGAMIFDSNPLATANILLNAFWKKLLPDPRSFRLEEISTAMKNP